CGIGGEFQALGQARSGADHLTAVFRQDVAQRLGDEVVVLDDHDPIAAQGGRRRHGTTIWCHTRCTLPSTGNSIRQRKPLSDGSATAVPCISYSTLRLM